MKRLARVVGMVVVAALLSGAGGLAQDKPSFIGVWRAVQPTSGITAARIFDQDGRLQVQLWGLCHPTDCDWGTTSFSQLPDAESKLPDRGLATFGGRYTTFRLDASELVIELYRVPDSGSAVRPYFGVIRLARGK